MAAQLTVMFAAAEDDTAGTYNGYSYERLLDYAIIYEYSGEAKGEIVLPEYVDGLKVLGVYGDLFEGCTELESAVFPDSYYNITGNVFGGCTSLKKVHLPESLEVMQCSFMDCTSLMELKIPESVTELLGYGYENSGFYNNPDNWDNGSFYYDNCLMMANSESAGEFHVKPGTRLIAKYAFAGNDNLTDVIFPDGLETICPAAFDSCSNLKEPVIPESVTYIGNGAFEDTGFFNNDLFTDYAEINLGSQLAFVGRKTEGKYTVKSGTKSIGGSAFHMCENITEVEIPEGVESVGFAAFAICDNIETISLPSTLKSIEAEAFAKCPKLKNITLPEGLRKIGYEAFFDCQNIKSVTIPKSCEVIQFLALGYYQEENYGPCKKMEDFKIYCYKGTAGEKYAIENGFDYEIIKEEGSVKSVKAKDITLNYKKSADLSVQITADPDAVYTVKYESFSPETVTVDENGNIYAAKKGSARVRVTVEDSNGNIVSDTCTVTVKYSAVQWIIKILFFGWLWY